MGKNRKRILGVRGTDEQLARVKELAERLGVDQNEAIHAAVQRALCVTVPIHADPDNVVRVTVGKQVLS